MKHEGNRCYSLPQAVNYVPIGLVCYKKYFKSFFLRNAMYVVMLTVPSVTAYAPGCVLPLTVITTRGVTVGISQCYLCVKLVETLPYAVC